MLPPPQADHSSPLRGLLAHLAEPLPAELFTPVMLGDFSRTTTSLSTDVKIAEGESPRPLDRVVYDFSYYNNIDKKRFSDPLEPIHSVDLYSHVFGLEKTLCDGLVSIGVRIPFHTFDAEAKQFTVTPSFTGPVLGPGGPGFTETDFGNISVIGKVVLLEDRTTGSVISAGASVTFPTADSGLDTTIVQPFVGYILRKGDFFIQGFTSVTLPLDRSEAIVLFNDIGVGYFVYQDKGHQAFLTALVPTLELHINTPLRQGQDGLFFDDLHLSDTLDVTLGTTFEFANQATLGVGLVTPFTGPRPFDIGALAQLNYRF
jgi:hypothetical protein